MNNLFVKKVCCLSSAFCRVSFRVFRKGYLFLAEDFQTWTFGSFVSRQKNIKSEKQSLFVDAVASWTSFADLQSVLSHQLYFLNISCIKIRVLSRTSLIFLWELKNAIISTNLRELCVIEPPKPNRKIPPTVPERSRRQGRGKEFFSINALVSRRHIISIALKSVCFKEHLWCSFGNSKTLSFQQLSVNFVILKQIQKIHTQWLRQAQPPIILLHVA